MFSSLYRFFKKRGDEKQLRRLRPLVSSINALEPSLKSLSDEDLLAIATRLRGEALSGTPLDSLLVEAYALVREAGVRVLGLRAFDVQLMGAIALHEGCIAEMKTGEGKTFTSVFAVFLNSFLGPVFILTANDYLAQRDGAWMKPLYTFLGLSVGIVDSTLDVPERKIQYQSSVTYTTASDIAFDYLRDHIRLTQDAIVLPSLHYAILDEADFLLIDEARVPLTLTGAGDNRMALYTLAHKIAGYMVLDVDFALDEADRLIVFHNVGLTKLETLLKKQGLLKTGSLFDPQHIDIYQQVQQSLRAKYLYHKDTDYIIVHRAVVLVDALTGRLQEGRRLGAGLHQALEAKEQVPILQEQSILATTTYQNFFRLFTKIAGMTGTATTEAQELKDVYGLSVVSLPTHRPLARVDKDDVIYATVAEKIAAIVDHIVDCHQRQQPVLVGTLSIEKSEQLSTLLKQKRIPHHVLNARYHAAEAEIIAKAGLPAAVTIATNMAGRGIDIQLGGNLELALQKPLRHQKDPEKIASITAETTKALEQARATVLQAGGLCIIGTERHESRRIDNQLRGRSGRQGDVGVSIFYLSMEDDLLRLFGGPSIQKLMQRLIASDKEPLHHPMVTKALARAQMQVEQRNFEYRKILLRYDTVLHDQREVFYAQRREIIAPLTPVMPIVLDMRDAAFETFFQPYMATSMDSWDTDAMRVEAHRLFGVVVDFAALKASETPVDTIRADLLSAYHGHFDQKLQGFTARGDLDYILRHALLHVMDKVWQQHLYALEQLRLGIGLRAYAQQDPLVAYKQEAFAYFNTMLRRIEDQFTMFISHASFVEDSSSS